MIAYIKGLLSSIQDDSIIIDVHGVGYEINCADPFSFQSSMNKEVFVHTYHHVKEDAQMLFGFKSEEQKFLFIKLISVSGIGPKGALAILGSVDIDAFVGAIEREDDKFLTSFPGVGKKTARQIILDLKGKLQQQFSLENIDNSASSNDQDNNQTITEAQEALKALGYTDKEIKAVVAQLRQDPPKTVDDMVRKALALLMK